MNIETLIIFAIACLSTVLFYIAQSNLRNLKQLKKQPAGSQNELVSILIPARNEYHNLRRCLNSLIKQDYANLEILVLDDQSTDQTSKLVKNYQQKDKRIHLLQGKDLPDNWIGKHWACHQLSESANGSIILFIDADTALDSSIVSKAVYTMINNNTDLISLVPGRKANCLIEKLMFPMIDWMTLCWLPIKLASSSKSPYLSASFGQFMLFKKEAYSTIGGHSYLRGNLLDDFELGREIKRNGLKWALSDGSKDVITRMYTRSSEAFIGLSRSIFPVFDYRLSIFIVAVIILTSLAILPQLYVINYILAGTSMQLLIFLAYFSMIMVALSWLVTCIKFNHNVLTTFIYPLIILIMISIGIHSVLTNITGTTSWKARKLNRFKIKP